MIESLTLRNKKAIKWTAVLLALSGLALLFFVPAEKSLWYAVLYGLEALLTAFVFYSSKTSKIFFMNPEWKWKLPVSGIINSIVIMTVIFLHSNVPFLWDSHIYYNVGDAIFDGGLVAWPSDAVYRGYVWPLIVTICKRLLGWTILNERMSFTILISIVYGFVLAWIVVKVSEYLFQRSITMPQVVLPVIWMSTFWWGLLAYPLSDIPACLMTAAAVILLWEIRNRLLSKKAIFFKSMLLGICAYGAYNIRTMYVVIWPLIFLPMVYDCIKSNKDRAKSLTALLLAVIGFCMIAWPQYRINQTKTGKTTPMIQTGMLFNTDLDLMTWQCVVGLQYQRYDTYLGKNMTGTEAHPMYFSDPLREEFLAEGCEVIRTKPQFIEYMLRNPVRAAGVYGRHYINLLDNRYPETYVQDLERGREPEVIIQYLMWFFGGVTLAYFYCQRNKIEEQKTRGWFAHWFDKKGLFLLIWILAPMLAAAGAIELRFFFAVYLLLYVFLANLPQIDGLGTFIKNNKWMIAGCAVAGFIGLNTVWSSTMASLARW